VVERDVEATLRPAIQRVTPTDSSPAYVVGIGAPAGGLTSLRRLLGRFTADHSAFIVATHLSPGHESEIVAVLGRATNMRVVGIETACVSARARSTCSAPARS
jgi:chemotaxis response regulator CheB